MDNWWSLLLDTYAEMMHYNIIMLHIGGVVALSAGV